MSVCLEWLSSHLAPFHGYAHAEKIQVSLKPDKNNVYFTWGPIYVFLSYLGQFFIEWEIFKTKVVKKMKRPFIFRIFFFSSFKIVPLMR